LRRTTSALVAVAALGLTGQAAAALPRATADRLDDWPRGTAQLHVVYVVPSDGGDRALDTSGTLGFSVDSFQRWLAGQSDGRALRLDTFGGELDVTFHRLARTDAEVASNGPFVRDVIERDLRSAGAIVATKLYAVYYDGSSTFACGGGAWPPVLPGQVGAMYLRGVRCPSDPIAAPGLPPRYIEFAMLHELFHTLGAVPQCAPHHTLAGHTSDDPRDLMYSGPRDWVPYFLDVGRDDYFGHRRSGCLDLASSPFLAPLGAHPPPVGITGFRAQGVPRAGRTFVVTARVVNDPHEVSCEASIGRRVLRTAVSRNGDRVRCSVRVPARTRGRLLLVTLGVERGGTGTGATFVFRIR
jgi:hypothetical protein